MMCAYKEENFEMSPMDFTELEDFIKEDTNLKPKSYSISYTKNNKVCNMKNQRHFETFVNGEPNDGDQYQIVLTDNDKPKPDNQEERKAEKPATDAPKPKPANQEVKKVTKPSTDCYTIAYD